MSLVLLGHTLPTHTASFDAAVQLQWTVVLLTHAYLQVLQRLHQPVALKLLLFQVRSQMFLAVRHQARQTRLLGFARTFDTRIAQHVVLMQSLILSGEEIFSWFLLSTFLDLLLFLLRAWRWVFPCDAVLAAGTRVTVSFYFHKVSDSPAI